MKAFIAGFQFARSTGDDLREIMEDIQDIEESFSGDNDRITFQARMLLEEDDESGDELDGPDKLDEDALSE